MSNGFDYGGQSMLLDVTSTGGLQHSIYFMPSFTHQVRSSSWWVASLGVVDAIVSSIASAKHLHCHHRFSSVVHLGHFVSNTECATMGEACKRYARITEPLSALKTAGLCSLQRCDRMPMAQATRTEPCVLCGLPGPLR